MKMKKSDLIVVILMYVVCGFFGVLTTGLKPEAQTYPWFVICILFVLNTLYVIKMAVAAKKHGVESGFNEIFEGFLPKQFWPIVVMTVLYVIVMYYMGFYVATVLYLVGALLYLKIPKWQILIILVVMFCLTYGAFTLFLKVKLPQGVWMKALLKLLK